MLIGTWCCCSTPLSYDEDSLALAFTDRSDDISNEILARLSHIGELNAKLELSSVTILRAEADLVLWSFLELGISKWEIAEKTRSSAILGTWLTFVKTVWGVLSKFGVNFLDALVFLKRTLSPGASELSVAPPLLSTYSLCSSLCCQSRSLELSSRTDRSPLSAEIQICRNCCWAHQQSSPW